MPPDQKPPSSPLRLTTGAPGKSEAIRGAGEGKNERGLGSTQSAQHLNITPPTQHPAHLRPRTPARALGGNCPKSGVGTRLPIHYSPDPGNVNPHDWWLC
ncbi:MAG: hypothetical protein P1P80_05970 [ANME-2 cluster archaeon]|nr:hypothetical protein [ANME-2 cluster archaeon]